MADLREAQRLAVGNVLGDDHLEAGRAACREVLEQLVHQRVPAHD